MLSVQGRIGKKEATATFEGASVTFEHNGKLLKRVSKTWFVYFQRVSKRLKTCDAVVFDGQEMTEFSTSQVSIDNIRDVLTCACYMGGLDPLPWKRILRDAKKHEWSIEDWQYHLEGGSSEESASDSDGDWQPASQDESSDDESSDDESSDDESSDDERAAKRRRIADGRNDPSSASE